MSRFNYTRRDFLKTVGLGAAALALPKGLFTAETDVDRPFDSPFDSAQGMAQDRPNILWNLSEDISPDLVGIRS